MSGILLDLFAQAAILAAFASLVLVALIVVEGLRQAWCVWRAEVAERRACERMDRQRALGLRERLTGTEIAERSRR